MKERSVIHSTFVIERSYPNTRERVFSAFSEPAQKRRWFAEAKSHEVESFEMDFRIGGLERAEYRFKEGTPFPGVALASAGSYQDIVPNERIVLSSTMSLGGKHISASLVTVEFLSTDQGTDLILTHQGAFFEGSDGPQMREGGWGQLLERLSGALDSQHNAKT